MPSPLVESVERWIAVNLRGHDVSTAAAAAAHAVSVRTLQRNFAAAGRCYSESVRHQRLAGALTEVAHDARSFNAIAHRWGFADASHFCRAFKRAFGVTPSDYRRGTGP